MKIAAKIIKIGSSLGIRMIKQVLWHLRVDKDDEVSIIFNDNNTITIARNENNA